MANWIKIHNQLINLNEYKTIDEPIYTGSSGAPGSWTISWMDKTGFAGIWYFNTESECNAKFAEISKILTSRFNFLE